MSYPKTQSALVVSDQLKPIVSTIPVSKPNNDQILIKTKAYGLGASELPILPQSIGAVYGLDNSGIVIEVGKNVQGFKVDDHVAAAHHGFYKPAPYPGAFAEYVICDPNATFKFAYKLKDAEGSSIPFGAPDTFESAATLAMSLITAGLAFYHGLDVQKGKDVSNESIIIASAGSAIGTVAVELAKWLGFKNIIVTASPHKFPLLKSLGATAFFDYRNENLVKELKTQFGEDVTYGLDVYATLESTTAMYNALSNTKPVFATDLKMNFFQHKYTGKTNPARLISFSAFSVLGDFEMFGHPIPVPEGIKKHYPQCKADLQKLVDEKQINVVPIIIMDGGLQSLIKGWEIVNEPRNSNEKLVARA